MHIYLSRCGNMITKQTVPNLELEKFTVGEIPGLFSRNRIKINEEYQRSEVWTRHQKLELIRSIQNAYSMGVLVLFINKDGQYEILDGQQRIKTIEKYLSNKLNLNGSGIKKYSKLDDQEKNLLNAYCIYYLELKSFNNATKEEDITQTFLRLQEGTPLNKAEKINAHRGKFKETFVYIHNNHLIFGLLGREYRFRFRLLAAELLLLELEGDFENKKFPDLDLKSFEEALKKYNNHINPKTVKFLKGNLDILYKGLYNLLTAIKIRDLISFYLLVSYLRKMKANNENFINEIRAFGEDFLKNLNSFSIYDEIPPAGMAQELFKKYREYKLQSRKATTSDSIESRFEFILSEYKRQRPFILKDKQRLFTIEQKRRLFFKQRGLCAYCGKPLVFNESSADHIERHSQGGRTILENGQLLHEACHRKIEKKRDNNG